MMASSGGGLTQELARQRLRLESMENLAVDSLPLTKVLPFFMLALQVYGVAEFAFVHYRLRKAKPGEYGMALEGP